MLLQKYLSRMTKGALVCGFFAAIFRGQSNNNPTVHKMYEYIIKVYLKDCHSTDPGVVASSRICIKDISPHSAFEPDSTSLPTVHVNFFKKEKVFKKSF